jgi:hypothetical protein
MDAVFVQTVRTMFVRYRSLISFVVRSEFDFVDTMRLWECIWSNHFTKRMSRTRAS